MVEDLTTRNVLALQPITNCLAVLIVHGTIQVYLLAIYAPAEKSPNEVKDHF